MVIGLLFLGYSETEYYGMGMWWQIAPHHIVNRKHRDYKKGLVDKIYPLGHISNDLPLPTLVLPLCFYHLPIMPSDFKSISGLTHWLGHSPWKTIIPSNPSDAMEPLIPELLRNISKPHHFQSSVLAYSFLCLLAKVHLSCTYSSKP